MRAPVNLALLRPAAKSQHAQKRVGRGQGSHHGGTAGRGNNGQKSRSGTGKPRVGFEGGQTPITKKFPKRGFINQNARTWAPVNLDRLQHWIDQGRLSSTPENPITARQLLLSGCVHDVHDGIKLLGNGAEHLKTPVYITPSRASHSAIRAVEKHGGSVVCRYYNPLSLRDCIKGREDRIAAAPTRREDIVWYTNKNNRGYLAPSVVQQIGHLPFVDKRWKVLSTQLSGWKKERVVVKKETAAAAS